MAALRILLVGAGAVGQVYGYHLQRGGARVAFLVKPAHAAAARAGFTLYPLDRKKAERAEPVPFTGFEVFDDPAAAAAERWDQIWLCISATALRAPWLDTLARAPGAPTIVALTPGLEDLAYVTARFPTAQVVAGLIQLVSYQAPLPGDRGATAAVPTPGVAYTLPGKNPFSGPDAARVAAVCAALSAGGYRARAVRDVTRNAAFGSAVLMSLLVALEASGWSFARLRREGHLRLATRAAGEAMRVVAAYRAERRPLFRLAVRPGVLGLVSRLAPRALPLDVETYLGYHFTKVGDQTAFMLERYTALGAERGVPTPALAEARTLLARVRGA